MINPYYLFSTTGTYNRVFDLAEVQTTDATVTALWSKVLAANSQTTFFGLVVGTCVAGPNVGKILSCTVEGTAVNAATEGLKPGAAINTITNDNAAWEVRADYTALTNLLRLTVKGTEGDTMNWQAKLIEITEGWS